MLSNIKDFRSLLLPIIFLFSQFCEVAQGIGNLPGGNIVIKDESKNGNQKPRNFNIRIDIPDFEGLDIVLPRNLGYDDKTKNAYEEDINMESIKDINDDQEIKDIEIIIDNVSLSREIELRSTDKLLSLKHLQLMRDIVSDADKLEMLGMSGVQRIVELEMHKNPNTKSEELKNIVKTVYNEKISKLLDENYIKTKPAREMARPLMQEIKNYIKMIS